MITKKLTRNICLTVEWYGTPNETTIICAEQVEAHLGYTPEEIYLTKSRYPLTTDSVKLTACMPMCTMHFGMPNGKTEYMASQFRHLFEVTLGDTFYLTVSEWKNDMLATRGGPANVLDI